MNHVDMQVFTAIFLIYVWQTAIALCIWPLAKTPKYIPLFGNSISEYLKVEREQNDEVDEIMKCIVTGIPAITAFLVFIFK
ncbi:hypothetical protein KPA96_13725 [Burkholderia cenocepacia]|uniref:hypothetical protein n=1 Tax=Burkholderia cenocepacia TaxID=95486 RepID=UPI0028589709|nr:hypothetical protein [Burkholderia cenocepacia]MDR8076716.1 hypothetical protein [Burkholderia cenocepacia]